MSGFVRSALLAAALGASLHADVFNIANTIPNMLYILLAGGIFNAVLVPQLVRAMRNDADGGDAYANRVITLAALFLAVVTVLLVARRALGDAALPRPHDYNDPDLAAQRESVITFARYCLPQVFFYGMYVLVGQILNARRPVRPDDVGADRQQRHLGRRAGRLPVRLRAGRRTGDVRRVHRRARSCCSASARPLGIVAQFVILLPYLRASGFTYRPRFDFRGTGLGHTLRLGIWTVLFVIVNQVAYTVVVRLASGGTAGSLGGDGTGYTIYSSTFLIMMVPHSVITVSLATAILPRLSARAAEHDLAGLARSLTETLRTALVVIVPFAMLLPVIALDLSNVIWGYGAAADTFDRFAPSLALFGIGLVFFTVHYLMLRGFYALERTRTVFWIQCAVGGHQHRGRGAAGPAPRTPSTPRPPWSAPTPRRTSSARSSRTPCCGGSSAASGPRAWSGSWSGCSSSRPSRPRRPSVRRTSCTTSSTSRTWSSRRSGSSSSPASTWSVFVALARLLRLTEVTSVIDTFTRRARVPRRA